jgi:high affinity Mn2+ porin
MNRRRPSWQRIFVFAALGILAVEKPATAADLPSKAPTLKAVYDWTGFYVGGHFGYGDASFGGGTNPLQLQGVFLPHSPIGLIGGFQMGYNSEFANHLVLGLEADASFTSPQDLPALAEAPFNTTLDYVGTLRGRIGYAFGRWMPFVTGGFAWGHSDSAESMDALVWIKATSCSWSGRPPGGASRA